MLKILSISLAFGFMSCGQVCAQEADGPWAPAYQAAPGSNDVGYSIKGANPKKCYPKAKVLLCSQLVQTLSADTIKSARLLANLSVSSFSGNEVLLPDGSSLLDEYRFGDPSSAAALYTITYRSTTIKGKPTKLSGLVVMPYTTQGSDASDGIVVYMHGTTAQRSNAPSDRSEETYGAITAFAGEKWAVAMPDYLGYGVNKQPHPYALGKLNAPSGIGIIKATRELSTYLHADLGKAIYVTGYSEGGGNSFWLGRALGELAGTDSSLQPTGIAPMSGPYDLSGATAKSFVVAQPANEAENITVKPSLLAFAGVAAAQVTKQPLTSLLQEALADQTVGLFPGPYADDDVGIRLLTTAVNDLDYLQGGLPKIVPHPENLLQQSLVEAILTQDMTNPAMNLWAQNDNVVWTPAAPTYMLGVIQDPLVPFAAATYPLPQAYIAIKGQPAPFAQGNTQNVLQSMRSRGLGNDKVAWLGFNGVVKNSFGLNETTMTHSAGFVPCSMLAAKFFKGEKALKDMPQLADP